MRESDDTTEMLNCAVALAPVASCTCAVKVDVPAAVGVPEMVPLAASTRPAGSEPPVRLKVYGAVPPEAVRAVV